MSRPRRPPVCPDARPYVRYMPASGIRRMSHLSTGIGGTRRAPSSTVNMPWLRLIRRVAPVSRCRARRLPGCTPPWDRPPCVDLLPIGFLVRSEPLSHGRLLVPADERDHENNEYGWVDQEPWPAEQQRLPDDGHEERHIRGVCARTCTGRRPSPSACSFGQPRVFSGWMSSVSSVWASVLDGPTPEDHAGLAAGGGTHC
jgi:hypothetical protein